MSKQKILNLIKEYETIIIHRHVRPDPDAYGSQGGLQQIIQATYPDKQVYIVGEADPDLDYLNQMDDIADETYKNALVIVCDTANTERICDQRYHLGEKLIKIDHHPNNDAYGDIVWVDTDASSTSEMVYELFQEARADGWLMTDESARLIYAGIVGDTGRFLFPSTTERTFKIASDLVRYHFDRSLLYDKLYEINHRIALLRGYILEHFTMTDTG